MCATATVQKQGPFWFFGERKQNSKRTTQKQRKAKRFAFWRRHHNEIEAHTYSLSFLLFSLMCFVIAHGSLRFSPTTIDLSTFITLWDLSFHKWCEFFAFFTSQVSTLVFFFSSILTASEREKVIVLKRLGSWVRKIWKQWRREGDVIIIINEIV